MPSSNADLKALRNLIAEAETMLATTILPEGRAERARELLNAAVKLADDLLKDSPAATLGAKGGKKTAECQGPRKTRPEGRRKNRPLPVREGVDLTGSGWGLLDCRRPAPPIQAARLGRSGRHPSPIVATCGEG